MLCLSRKVGERIVIQVPGYSPIDVHLVAIAGNRVRLGFDADDEIEIHRAEVLERAANDEEGR